MKDKKNKKAGRKKILIAVIAVVVCAGGFYGYSIYNVPQVDIAEASIGEVQEVVKEVGSITSKNASIVVAKNNFDIEKINYAIGDAVYAGELIMTTDVNSNQMDIKSMQAQASGLRSQYNLAKQSSSQLKELYENGAASKQDYDTAVTNEQELSSQIQSLEYSIKSVQNNEQSNRVDAPISGVITELYVSEGDTAILGAPLVEISDVDNLTIKVNLMADDASKIKVGNEVIINDDATAIGHVEKIYPKVKEELSDLGIVQKRIEMDIAFDTGYNTLIGSDIDVEIVSASKQDTLFVEKKSIFSIDQKDYVYVVDAGKIAQKEVSIGLKGEYYYEVLSGLNEGDLVVLSPSSELTDGKRVKVTAEG